MLIGLRLLWEKGKQATRRPLRERLRRRISIVLTVYAAIAVIAALGVAVFVGDSGDKAGWQTDDDGKWFVAVLPASEYRSHGDGEGWAHLYVMCDRLEGALRIGLGLGAETVLQGSAEGDAEVGIWEVIYTVGEAGGFAEVWAAVANVEGAYLSPPEPDEMSDRFLAGGHLVAWAADLRSSGSGHEAVFDLGGYAEDVASEMGGCGGSLRV